MQYNTLGYKTVWTPLAPIGFHKRKPHMYSTTWDWVNNVGIFISEWTIPKTFTLKSIASFTSLAHQGHKWPSEATVRCIFIMLSFTIDLNDHLDVF